ncbi:hypothetical protein JQN58_03635 [Aneurinibacillus sp. BA2021]|nr:hypothetical protein [Aneurinibacillus sp. BA2021]
MQYLYLHRLEQPEKDKVSYVYQFDAHGLSPSNLVLRNLFSCMLKTVEQELTDIEIEYNDIEMAKLVGMEAAVAFLTAMGAREVEQKEYRQNGVLLSRTFTAVLTPERLAFFFNLRDLDIAYRLRFMSDGEERIHMYFAKTLSCTFSTEDEAAFTALLAAQHVPHKVLEGKR